MDVIDNLVGIQPGSFLDTLRRQKPITRDNAQASFDALFAPADLQDMSAAERAAIAYFLAGLHAEGLVYYSEHLSTVAPGLLETLDAEIAHAAGSGPYGSFPPGPLTDEDAPGPEYAVTEKSGTTLGARLTAALEHAHMLVFHPRDAAPTHMRALEAAGWSATGIVTLSQLVSFLAFQLRVTAGLRALDRNRS